MSRPALRRALPMVVGVVALAVGAFVIYRDRSGLADSVRHLGVTAAVLSLVCAVAGGAATLPLWRTVLAGLEAHPGVRDASRVFFVSQLGKYLPGSVWPVVAQMEFGRRQGISRRTMLAANVVTIAISLAVGLAVAAALLPLSSPATLRRYWWAYLLLPFLLACLHPRAVPAMVDLGLRLLRRKPLGQRLAGRAVPVAAGWSLVSWLLLGVHVFVIAVAFGAAANMGTLAATTGGTAFAVAVGIAVIPAPAGAGIRDAVLVLTLTPVLGATEALATALASRVLLVLTDVLLAAAAGLWRQRGSGRVEPDRRESPVT